MPQQEGGLKGIYYTVSDKGWSLAEWLEAKGLPVATFCESRHVNPLLLFLAVFLAILVIILLVAGAFGGVSYGTLRVNVESDDGVPLGGAVVSYSWNGDEISNNTDDLGKAFLSVPKGADVNIFASKDSYNTASQRTKLEGDADSGTITIKLKKRVGSLKVNVDVASGKPLPSGAYVSVNSPGEVAAQESVSNGEALFEDLPAGIKITPYLKVGKQSIPGDEVTIREGETVESDITVPDSALATGIQIKVKDSAGQNVNGAEVRLYDWNTQTPIGSTQKTVMGVATFNDIPMGSTLFATVNPAADTPQYSSYNGKNSNQQFIISTENPAFAVELQIVGLVKVCTYDESGSPLMDGTVRLWGTDGKSYSSSKPIDQECEEFTGITPGVKIYPEVNAPGYAKYLNPSKAQTVDYSRIITFDVDMSPLSGGQGVTVFAHVSDCNGKPLNGAKVIIVDASTYAILGEATTACGSASVTLTDTCGNIQSMIASGTDIYAVAWDNNHILGVSGVEVAGPDTVLDLEICKADDSNSGAVSACVYKDAKPFNGAHLELRAADDKLLRTATANDGEENNCYVFRNLPDGESVYVTALDLGTNSEDSDLVTIVAGDVINVVIYAGTAPIFLAKGDVEICVKDSATNMSMVANVTLYDHITGAPIIAGQTAARGCRLFSGLEAETASGGKIVPREVYVVAAKTGYGDYSGAGKDIADMVPNGTLKMDVYLSEAFDVCVQLRASDTSEPLSGSIVLYYDEEATAPIEKKKSGSDGVVHFAQAKKDDYYFKVIEDLTLYDPLEKYSFSQEEISAGTCGLITLYDLGSLCELGVELVESGTVETPLGEKSQIAFTILKGGERADNSILDEGTTATAHEVQLTDGKSANVTLWVEGKQKSFALKYASTSEGAEAQLTAELEISTTGNYSSTLQVSENELCSRQALFDLLVFEEALKVTMDSVKYDPVVDQTKTFCIYVKDQDDEDVTDASVTLSVDEMDGWAQSATKTASYDEVKACYKAAFVSSMAPEDDGSYLFSVIVKRDDLTKIVTSEAQISRSELCGNGEVDSSEACDASATNDTGCDEDMECNDDCSACEEAECGDLMVSADSATLEIGSGKSAGLCIYVSDDCGDVDDATVQAKLYGDYGWPTDTSLSAGYDSARGCYYTPISESVAWPASYRPADLDDALGTKSVAIAATKGESEGSGTGEVTITCGCNEEDWCECNCKCDKDCEDGFSGNLDFFGCLTLMGQNGYSPGGCSGYQSPQMSPWSSPYQTGGMSQYPYPSGYGGYPGGLTNGYNPQMSSTSAGGGMSIGTNGLSISGPGGGISLGLEQCKSLFGGGSGKGSKVSAAVLIKDPDKVIDSKACIELQNHFINSKDFKYMFVETDATSDKSECCTDKAVKGSICSREKFDKLMESKPDDRTVITIAGAKALVKGKVPGITIITNEAEGGDNIAISSSISGASGLYSRGAVFAGQGKDKKELVWGYVGPSKDAFKRASKIWFGSNAGDNPVIGYPEGTPDIEKTIIISDISDIDIEGVKLSTSDFEEAKQAWPIGEDTRLYVIGTYQQIEENDVLKLLAPKFAYGISETKFKTLPEDSKLDACAGGQFKDKGFSPRTMLLAENKYYVVGLADEPAEVCSETGKMLTTNAFDQDTALNLAYVKKKGLGSYLLVLGKESGADDFIQKFITRFGIGEAKGTGSSAEKSGSMVILTPEKFGIIRPKCLDKVQTCTVPDGVDALNAKLVEDMPKIAALGESADLKAHILNCICGDGENLPASVNVTLTDYLSDKIKNSDISPENIFFTVTKSGDTKRTQEISAADLSTVDVKKAAFTIPNFEVGEGTYTIKVSVAGGVNGCAAGTGTVAGNDLEPGKTKGKSISMSRTDKDCPDSGKTKYTISGRLLSGTAPVTAGTVTLTYGDPNLVPELHETLATASIANGMFQGIAALQDGLAFNVVYTGLGGSKVVKSAKTGGAETIDSILSEMKLLNLGDIQVDAALLTQPPAQPAQPGAQPVQPGAQPNPPPAAVTQLTLAETGLTVIQNPLPSNSYTAYQGIPFTVQTNNLYKFWVTSNGPACTLALGQVIPADDGSRLASVRFSDCKSTGSISLMIRDSEGKKSSAAAIEIVEPTGAKFDLGSASIRETLSWGVFSDSRLPYVKSVSITAKSLSWVIGANRGVFTITCEPTNGNSENMDLQVIAGSSGTTTACGYDFTITLGALAGNQAPIQLSAVRR